MIQKMEHVGVALICGTTGIALIVAVRCLVAFYICSRAADLVYLYNTGAIFGGYKYRMVYDKAIRDPRVVMADPFAWRVPHAFVSKAVYQTVEQKIY